MKTITKSKTIVSLIIVSILLSMFSSVLTFAEEEKKVPLIKLEDEFAMFEAEDGYILGGWKTREHKEASGGVILNPSVSSLNNDPQGRKKEQGGNDLQFLVESENDKYYTVWVRIHFLINDSSRSGNFWVDVNGHMPSLWFTAPEPGAFMWVPTVTTKFKKGINEIGVQPRRVNVAIDKILITSSEFFIPYDLGQKPDPFILGEEGESKKRLDFPLPAYTPPEEHPRIFLREADIPKIKENLTHPENIKAWENVQNIAKQDKDCKMTSTAAYSFDQSIHEYLECCAFMYGIDKINNLFYGKKAVSGLKDYLSTLQYSGGDGDDKFARAGLLLYISKVYDWCYDLLSEEDKEFFIKKGLQIAGKGEIGWPPKGLDAYSSDHGSEGGLQIELMSLAIATYGDYNDIWNAVAGRYFSQWIHINNFYYNNDQWYAEGDSYGKGRFSCEAKGNTILYKMGLGGLVSKNEQFQNLQQIYRKRTDGAFMQDGDIWDYAFNNNGASSPMLSLASRYNNPFYKYEVYKLEPNGYEADGAESTYGYVDFLILNDTSLELKSNEALPLTWYSGEGNNMMTARTSWDDGFGANTMIVSMKGGGRWRGGHMHLDGGNFMIYYKGPLALDSGVYSGLPFVDDNGKQVTNVHSGSYHYANYQHRTVAHNCILVYDPDQVMKFHNLGELNDGGQLKENGRYVNEGTTGYEKATDDSRIYAKRLGVDYGPDMNKPSYSYLKTDLTDAYTKKVKEYTRTFMFQNLFDDTYPGALIVFDKVSSSNPEFKKTWLLHSEQEPVVEGNKTVIDRTERGYNGRLTNYTLLPKSDDLSITKIGGEGKEYMVGDVYVKAVTSGIECGKWRIDVNPKTPKETDYFLNVMYVNDADDTIPYLNPDLYESGNHVGVKIKDRVSYLTKNSQRTSREVVVYAEGNEEKLLWTVDGLNKGRWQIIDENNNQVAISDVTEEGGIAYFELKPGAYKLVKLRGYNNIPSKSFNVFDSIDETKTEISNKFMYNNLYYHLNNPIINENGLCYLPFSEVCEIVDKKFKLERNGDNINFEFQDALYSLDLNTTKATKKLKGTKITEEREFADKLIEKDGVLYASTRIFGKLLSVGSSYDSIGKISRITSHFKRAEDYIVNSIDTDRITVAATSGTDIYAGREAYMALDNNHGTPAGANTIGATLTYEFDKVETLDKISVAWYNSTTRDYIYEFLVSEDGENWTTVLKGNSGLTLQWTDYDIDNIKAKYVKIICNGNVLNDWFNINEIRFYKQTN
ncbi:MAG: discoidin domain-containing protein [Ruminococcaceae bacterium]|nr:discoidin domain-containing protein [Oscillospiraceae bacterium]